MPKKSSSDNQPEYIPPDNAIESFARCLLPAIQAYYDSEEGQKAFDEWKRSKEKNYGDKSEQE